MALKFTPSPGCFVLILLQWIGDKAIDFTASIHMNFLNFKLFILLTIMYVSNKYHFVICNNIWCSYFNGSSIWFIFSHGDYWKLSFLWDLYSRFIFIFVITNTSYCKYLCNNMHFNFNYLTHSYNFKTFKTFCMPNIFSF